MTIDFTLSPSLFIHTHQSIFLIEYYQRKSIEQGRQNIVLPLLYSSLHLYLPHSSLMYYLDEILKKREKERERACMYVRKENDDVKGKRERESVCNFLVRFSFFCVRFFFINSKRHT